MSFVATSLRDVFRERVEKREIDNTVFFKFLEETKKQFGRRKEKEKKPYLAMLSALIYYTHLLKEDQQQVLY